MILNLVTISVESVLPGYSILNLLQQFYILYLILDLVFGFEKDATTTTYNIYTAPAARELDAGVLEPIMTTVTEEQFLKMGFATVRTTFISRPPPENGNANENDGNNEEVDNNSNDDSDRNDENNDQNENAENADNNVNNEEEDDGCGQDNDTETHNDTDSTSSDATITPNRISKRGNQERPPPPPSQPQPESVSTRNSIHHISRVEGHPRIQEELGLPHYVISATAVGLTNKYRLMRSPTDLGYFRALLVNGTTPAALTGKEITIDSEPADKDHADDDTPKKWFFSQ